MTCREFRQKYHSLFLDINKNPDIVWWVYSKYRKSYFNKYSANAVMIDLPSKFKMLPSFITIIISHKDW